MAECSYCIKSMKSGKLFGAASEFYRAFSSDISLLLTKAVNCAYERRIISVTQSGVISFITKDKNATKYHTRLRL